MPTHETRRPAHLHVCAFVCRRPDLSMIALTWRIHPKVHLQQTQAFRSKIGSCLFAANEITRNSIQMATMRDTAVKYLLFSFLIAFVISRGFGRLRAGRPD